MGAPRGDDLLCAQLCTQESHCMLGAVGRQRAWKGPPCRRSAATNAPAAREYSAVLVACALVSLAAPAGPGECTAMSTCSATGSPNALWSQPANASQLWRRPECERRSAATGRSRSGIHGTGARAALKRDDHPCPLHLHVISLVSHSRQESLSVSTQPPKWEPGSCAGGGVQQIQPPTRRAACSRYSHQSGGHMHSTQR